MTQASRLKDDPQHGFEDESIPDDRVEQQLTELLDDYQEQKTFIDSPNAAPVIEAQEKLKESGERIKSLLEQYKDGSPHRFRINGHVLIIGDRIPPGHREFDTSAQQRIKIQLASED